MPPVAYGWDDFKRDPVRHVVIPLLVEFISQFTMTFWGVMVEKPQYDDVNLNTTKPGDMEMDYMSKYFAPAFQSGISVWICIMVYSRMSYAPAQFSPAITTTLVIVGTVPALMLVPNIIMQCLSSLLAAYVSQLIRGAPPPALIIPEDVGSLSILFNEIIMVASITIIAAELTQNAKVNEPLGVFGVGMAVFMCLLSGRWTGVVCLSPSRVFGPAVLIGGPAWNRHWLLWTSDILGAIAAGVFWLLFLAPEDRSWLGRFTKQKEKKTDLLMEETKRHNESE